MQVQIERDAPKYLYKFTKLEFAEDLVSKGSFRLGTIFEYRDSLSYAAGQHDEHEGAVRVVGRLPSGYFVQASIVTRPKWMFCVSSSSDPKLLPEFGADYNAIVEIEARPFFRRLCEYMRAESDLAELRMVQYLTEEDLLDFNFSENPGGDPILPCAATLKRRHFRIQDEWRITFEPNERLWPAKRNSLQRGWPNGINSNYTHSSNFRLEPYTDSRVPVHAVQPKVPCVVPQLARYCRIIFNC